MMNVMKGKNQTLYPLQLIDTVFKHYNLCGNSFYQKGNVDILALIVQIHLSYNNKVYTE